jgi:hypothetical protein
VKKLLVAAVLGVSGAIAVRKLTAGRAEQDLWREATDPIR